MFILNYNKKNFEKKIENDIIILTNENKYSLIIINNNEIDFTTFLNMLPQNFDNYADLNNQKILILYDTLIYKVIFKNINESFILILFNNNELFIYILEDCFDELLVIIKHFYKKKILINNITYNGLYNKKSYLLLYKICSNININN